jgi:hypothetical protein
MQKMALELRHNAHTSASCVKPSVRATTVSREIGGRGETAA